MFRYDFEAVQPEKKEEKREDETKSVNTDKNRLMFKMQEPKIKKKSKGKDEFHTKDLPFRVDGEETSLFRIYYFLNAPIIKFVHHMVRHLFISKYMENIFKIFFLLKVLHMIFLLVFCYFILFGYEYMPTALPAGVNYTSPLLLGFINTSAVKMPLPELFIIFYVAMDLVGEIRKVLNF